MIVINDKYCDILIDEIRNKETDKAILQSNLIQLGERMAQKIVADHMTQVATITTPMDITIDCSQLVFKRIVIISTRDDYNFFANGISNIIRDSLRGYMDFNGVRGPEALTQPIRSISLPKLQSGQLVDSVIVAKSVLATGCTALSLSEKAMEVYRPKRLIIASVYYSQLGIMEMLSQFPNAEIYVFGKPDSLNENGMLIPGVGNIDARLMGVS